MHEARVLWCSMPVFLASRHVDDITGSDDVPVVLRGENASSRNAVKNLRHVMGVQVSARTWRESDERDADTSLSTLDDRLDADFTDEVFGVEASN